MQPIKADSAPDLTSLPKGVKILALGRTVRWIGWGFGEALLPIFIAGFSASFAEAGLFRATYDIVMLVILPVVGDLADRYPARTLIIAELALGPFIGVSYYLAGVTNLAIFIVIARALNGITWSFEEVAMDTYYRRVAPAKRLSSAFGFLDSVTDAGWIIAAIASIVLVKYFPIHVLLLAITPFTVLALVISMFAPRDAVEKPAAVAAAAAAMAKSAAAKGAAAYAKMMRQFKTWNRDLRIIAALVFFIEVVYAFIGFFLPIYVYRETGELSQSILIAIAVALPSLLAYPLGKIADAINEKLSFVATMAVIVVSFTAFATVDSLAVRIISVLAVSVFIELFSISQRSYITKLTPAALYGEQDSTMEELVVLGDIAGPILVGVAFDAFGSSATLLTLAGLSFIVFISTLFLRHASAASHAIVPENLVHEP